MIKTAAIAAVAFAMSVALTGVVGAQTTTTTPTTTPSPTTTTTTTPTPTGSVQGSTTVPSGAPATGHGGY
jgi:hypothetical protein